MSAVPRRPSAPLALFAIALVGSGTLLLVWLGDLTFWRDEWGFLLERRGLSPDVFLEPHYEHIAISLIAVYKTLLGVFGMGSPFPFQLVATLTFLLSVALLFAYLSRRVGRWLALAGTLPILVLGPAWDDLLWPFQLGFFASMSAGLGALLALERRDRGGDLVACALLVVAISFSSLGLPFIAGAAVLVGWDRDRLRRAWIVAVPAGLYALWWLGWGREADNFVSLHNLATSVSYVADGFATSLGSLLGLGSARDEVLQTPLDWGRTLLLIAVALGAWRLHRVGRISRELCAVVVIAAVFWLLAGLNASILRYPSSGRYQYMGAIFILLIAAEVMRGYRPRPPIAAAALAVAVIAALSNLSGLRDGHRELVGFGQLQPAALAVLELASETVDPAFELTLENSGVEYLGFVSAGSYLSAVDRFGSPAFTPEELSATSEKARAAADTAFAAALELELTGAPRVRCTSLAIPPGEAVELPPGGAILAAADSGVEVRLRRYAGDGFPVSLGRLGPGESALLRIPEDRSTEPWEIEVGSGGEPSICEPDG